jgi:hypothetical protein
LTTFTSLYANEGQYKNPLRDRFQRDRYYNSFNRQIFEPVLSRQVQEEGFTPRYPGNKKMAVCISHDIDHLYLNQTRNRKLVNVAGHLLQGRWQKGIAAIKAVRKEPVFEGYKLENILGINRAFNIRSSYYFLSLANGDEDYSYELADIRDQLDAVLAGNCEIGLHGGHEAFNNPGKLIAEKQRLEKALGAPVKGYRNHYLRFSLPDSWQNLLNAGFLYDTTFAYADCIGFRNGMCYPFYPYDPVKKEFIGLVELPLIMMDATLFFYMRLDPPTILKVCREFMEKIAACGGVFTLLWHNNFMTGEERDLYQRILELLAGFDPWFTTSAELVGWWKEEKLLEQSHAIIQKLINAEANAH